MTIVNFTPVASLLGGALIGFSAVGLMATLGRIAGLTGIVRGVLPPWRDGQQDWRMAFILGAIAAPALLWALHYGPIGFSVPVPVWSLPISGLIVGFGAVYANGCPSGHGVCGLARLSPRSAVSVATFMATAAFTVYFVRYGIGG